MWARYQLGETQSVLGKMVQVGKLQDGSAHYKGRTAWALEANQQRQQQEDAEIKSSLITEIISLQPRHYQREDLTTRSMTRLFELLRFDLL